MKTPDKIYLNKYMIRPGMLHPAQYPADTPEFKYIRKDALLEWAEEEMGNWSSESTTGQGVKMGITLILDKLKSL